MCRSIIHLCPGARTRYLERCDWSSIVRPLTNHRKTCLTRLSRYKSVNIPLFSSSFHSMGRRMQCLLCGRRFSSSGQFFLKLFRQMPMAPSVVNVFVRGIVLFILGAFIALVLFMFSVLPEVRRKRIHAVDFGIVVNLFSTVWWIAPSSGTVAALVGIIYPCTDVRLGKPHKLQREWSSVAKCVVLFLGISHACAKISFNSPKHFSLFMAVASLILWWLFDRSKNGLGLAVLVTACTCAALQFLIYLGLYRTDEPDFLYARAWIPWYFFSGVVTFGTIGRQLAMTEYNVGRIKEHID